MQVFNLKLIFNLSLSCKLLTSFCLVFQLPGLNSWLISEIKSGAISELNPWKRVTQVYCIRDFGDYMNKSFVFTRLPCSRIIWIRVLCLLGYRLPRWNYNRSSEIKFWPIFEVNSGSILEVKLWKRLHSISLPTSEVI